MLIAPVSDDHKSKAPTNINDILKTKFEIKRGGKYTAHWIAVLLLTQGPQVQFSAFQYFKEIFDIAEICRQHTALKVNSA